MTYEAALAYISSLEARGWRLGLDRMDELVRRAELSDCVGGASGPQFIQVAGTNGKGSTTAFIQSMLVESGYRTGAFFSPFVVDPRERVQFGRDLIGKQELADVVERLIPAAESFSEMDFGGVSEFELKTAVGLEYWRQKQCEWVALEVGLGGRLDATTVVTPKACVIVSIGLDHVHILGDTHAKIAAEKAGIIKPGVPVVIGEMPREAEEVILAVAAESGAPAWRWGREVLWREDSGVVETPMGCHPGMRPGIPGAAQAHNMALAAAAIDAAGAYQSNEALAGGAELASIPGRFQMLEWKGRAILFDGAHNAEAAEVLARSLRDRFDDRRCLLVTNMLAGHEPDAFYEAFRDRVTQVFVAPIDFHRAMPVNAMVDRLAPLFDRVEGYDTPLAGLEAAITAAEHDDLILVTGTFYLVGELLRKLHE